MKRFHAAVAANALARRNGVPPPLYLFTSATFTSAGVTGQTGPNLAQCKDAYSTAGYSWATDYLDMTTQGYQLWTVPRTGNYIVTCAGASIYTLASGFGKGIVIQTTISLTKGDQIQLLVGQRGTPASAAGFETDGAGGGSFVASGVTPATGVCLVAAGGGGSFRPVINTGDAVQNAVVTTSGAAGLLTSGGTAGLGGDRSFYLGGGGGGFIGNGTRDGGVVDSLPYRGTSFRNGGLGGDYRPTASGGAGGFGGGAGGGTYGTAGGGGGGYSGGGIGNAAGGGGSFPSGATYIGMNTGDGYITIAAA